MGATLYEAETLAQMLRARLPYCVEIEADFDNNGRYYLALIAEFGTEIDLETFLPEGWVFSGWRNQDQRALLGMAEKR